MTRLANKAGKVVGKAIKKTQNLAKKQKEPLVCKCSKTCYRNGCRCEEKCTHLEKVETESTASDATDEKEEKIIKDEKKEDKDAKKEEKSAKAKQKEEEELAMKCRCKNCQCFKKDCKKATPCRFISKKEESSSLD